MPISIPSSTVGSSTIIPPALAALAAEQTWIAWRWYPVSKTTKDGEQVISWTKCPCDAGGRVIKSNDPSHMRDAEFFLSELRKGTPPFSGLALACVGNVRGDRLVLDLDKCIDPQTGVITEWARGIVDACNSYTEISPSGTGIRIIGGSTGWRVDNPQRYNFWTGPERAAAGHKETGEAFFQTGFVTVTLNPLPGYESRWSPIGALASCLDKRPGRIGKTSDDGERVSSEPLAPPEVVRETLMLISNDGTVPNNWNQWNEIGMTVFRSTDGSDAGLDIWTEWSMQHPHYGLRDNCDDRWEHWRTSSPPTMVGYGSLHREVKEMYARNGYLWSGGDLWWEWNESRKRQKIEGMVPGSEHGLLDIEVTLDGDLPLRASDATPHQASMVDRVDRQVDAFAHAVDRVDGQVDQRVTGEGSALVTLPWMNPALQGGDAVDGQVTVAAAGEVSAVPQTNPGGSIISASPVVPIPARNTALRAPANLASTMDRFAQDPLLAGIIGYDLMTHEIMMMNPVPGTQPNSEFPRPLQDVDAIGLLDYLQRIGFQKMAISTVWHAVEKQAHLNEYHPVRDYLNGLKWDGVERVGKVYVAAEDDPPADGKEEVAEKDLAGGWMTRYLGVRKSRYARHIGRMFLISMVARVMEPGCQVDHVPVLFGPQGALKSTACQVLGGAWYSNNLPMDIGSKDAKQHSRGKWITEVAEFSAFGKADNEKLKDFTSRRVEVFRPPYGRTEVKEPRQCVFIATTNDPAPFKDPTGNRRFWPVDVGTIDIPGLRRDRDMLFAEAFQMYKAGVQWWPEKTFEQQVVAPEQDDRFETDILEDKVAAWLRELQRAVTVMDVIKGLGQNSFDWVKISTREQRRVVSILQHLGWEQKRSGPDGARYYRPINLSKWEIKGTHGSFDFTPWIPKNQSTNVTELADFKRKGIAD